MLSAVRGDACKAVVISALANSNVKWNLCPIERKDFRRHKVSDPLGGDVKKLGSVRKRIPGRDYQ